jgi:tetratricopeptide (TPR) repeat protein
MAFMAAPASAEAKASDVEELFLEAVQAHKDGESDQAIKLLKQAVKADDDPTLLYNVAVLSDRAGDSKTAATFYRRYLDTDPPDAVVVKLRFQQISPGGFEAWAKANEKDAAPGRGGGRGDAMATTTGDGEGQQDKVVTAGAGRRGKSPLLSYGLIGGGALALAVGATFGALTVSDVNEFMNAKVRREAQQHADNARSHQLLANVGYLAGMAALGGGVAILLLQDAGANAVASAGPQVTPLLTPASAGASVVVGF